jgi:hypothetical protein
VKVDELPRLAAMMLLSHCYHGSITFGLMNSPTKQCNQLLEMALVAEEYLCPSLLLECELRLLMHTSRLEKHNYNACICVQCSGGAFLSEEKSDVLLDSAKINLGDDKKHFYCEYVGVYVLKTATPVKMSLDGACLITPENGLDILAIAQQLEQSSCCRREHYGLKFCCSGGNAVFKPTSSCGVLSNNRGKVVGTTECIFGPFAAAKMMAVWIMLQNFPAVVRGKSYLNQINRGDTEDDNMDEVDESFTKKTDAGKDKFAILLLQTCLEELACSPLI